MSLTDRFFDLPPELLTALGTVLGFILVGGLDYDQQDVLGNWLELVGELLETSAAQGQLQQQRQQSARQDRRLDALERELAALRQELRRFQGSTAPMDAVDSGRA